MNKQAILPPFAAIVVAAGKGTRAGQDIPKQFAMWRGRPVIRHSTEALSAAGASPIVVAIPPGHADEAGNALAGIEGIHLVKGGATRQESVFKALQELSDNAPPSILIHDAARPDLPADIIARLLLALDKHDGAIPVLPVVDSLARDTDGFMTGAVDRDSIRRVQTPQAFRTQAIASAHAAWHGALDAGDDAQVLQAAGGSVAFVEGDERLKKLTFAEDFSMTAPLARTGLGFDVHRLVTGGELWLGGIRIEHDKGLAGHSDADVALHAIVDALLGATAQGDIGQHFLPSDSQWKDASSDRFLKHAGKLVGQAGYRIGNIDLTIICEAPKIGPYRDAMRLRIAELLGVDTSQVSVKATTTEGLGLTGRGEGIAAQAIATVEHEG